VPCSRSPSKCCLGGLSKVQHSLRVFFCAAPAVTLCAHSMPSSVHISKSQALAQRPNPNFRLDRFARKRGLVLGPHATQIVTKEWCILFTLLCTRIPWVRPTPSRVLSYALCCVHCRTGCLPPSQRLSEYVSVSGSECLGNRCNMYPTYRRCQ
jgi:hypothetical protein